MFQCLLTFLTDFTLISIACMVSFNYSFFHLLIEHAIGSPCTIFFWGIMTNASMVGQFSYAYLANLMWYSFLGEAH
jgi:hypothetical protein